MAGERFYLKYRDTRPILEVTLLDPPATEGAAATAHDCTGADSAHLHIYLNNDTTFTAEMTFDADRTTGKVYYTWQASDWDTLFVGPTLPLSSTDVDHKMEYEVIDGSARLTFPNDGYDYLTIYDDLGQGS